VGAIYELRGMDREVLAKKDDLEVPAKNGKLAKI